MVFLKTLLIKYFSHSLQQSQPDKEQDLGLSLSYDIITKEHNGTIKVESERRRRNKVYYSITNCLKIV